MRDLYLLKSLKELLLFIYGFVLKIYIYFNKSSYFHFCISNILFKVKPHFHLDKKIQF